ncbi:MAG: CbrC family protein [Acidobacteriia bacterium]|nr:CbrC family protein [Terriglobia bacterium]
MNLPSFKYHPDPLSTGSVMASDKRCQVCRQPRGFVYTGTIHSISDLETVCPWCIHDGAAHILFHAEFTALNAVGGYGEWEPVPQPVSEEVAFRTPGFSGWQQERWFTHCGDAAAFLGPMGRAELEELGQDAASVICRESGFRGDDWGSYFKSMDRHGGPTAYLFRCLHCGCLGGYSDSH